MHIGSPLSCVFSAEPGIFVLYLHLFPCLCKQIIAKLRPVNFNFCTWQVTSTERHDYASIWHDALSPLVMMLHLDALYERLMVRKELFETRLLQVHAHVRLLLRVVPLCKTGLATRDVRILRVLSSRLTGSFSGVGDT